jgi:methylmalonyl-CoA/ethylmalonyl-CoA epimerase
VSTDDLASTLERAIGAGRVDQVAFLVEDLRVATARWSALYREDTWRIYTYDATNVEHLSYRGAPGEFSMRLALLGSAPQIELIQPLSGPSIYHDWIERHGYGPHHFGFFVPSIRDAVAEFEAAGHPTTQSGSGYGLDGDGGFAYFDFEATYGIDLEVIEVPARRRPSEPLP